MRNTAFFEAGTTAFLWEVPAYSVVLSKARGENWTWVLLLVLLIDELLFSPRVPAAALPAQCWEVTLLLSPAVLCPAV